MQPTDTRVVELLNEALTYELTVVNTYFLNYKMLEDQGLPGLAKRFKEFSFAEMRDAEELIERILFLDGHPNLQKLNAIRIGETPREMLELALESEKVAIETFNEAAKYCREVNDNGSYTIFAEMVRDEEEHADWFESQLAAIGHTGIEGYLAEHLGTDD